MCRGVLAVDINSERPTDDMNVIRRLFPQTSTFIIGKLSEYPRLSLSRIEINNRLADIIQHFPHLVSE